MPNLKFQVSRFKFQTSTPILASYVPDFALTLNLSLVCWTSSSPKPMKRWKIKNCKIENLKVENLQTSTVQLEKLNSTFKFDMYGDWVCASFQFLEPIEPVQQNTPSVHGLWTGSIEQFLNHELALNRHRSIQQVQIPPVLFQVNWPTSSCSLNWACRSMTVQLSWDGAVTHLAEIIGDVWFQLVKSKVEIKTLELFYKTR